ncbi:uncharacterized protein LOC127288911 [Leptopilina boulardi]|uniref:uncharacterized protein LOC127288911 n=1 Tax=Leptopilina boulardi TaxID=63433 RepID=UPI0021F564F0|nr:uncharacterized protein LOC127288911 [Leptopilina boulardi]
MYGHSLRLPGEFLGANSSINDTLDPAGFVVVLRQLRDIKPTGGSRHGSKRIFVFKDLATTEQVLVRHNAPKQPLQQPYDGPFKVVKRFEKTFLVSINGRDINVSIDRLKSAYVLANDPEAIVQSSRDTSIQEDAPSKQIATPEQEQNSIPHSTRSDRRVRFPDRLQDGFS